MSPQITAHSRRSGNVVPLCLGTALRLIFDCSAYCPAHRHPQERGSLTAEARYVRPFVLLACPVQLFSRGALFLVPPREKRPSVCRFGSGLSVRPISKAPRCDESSRLPFSFSSHGLLAMPHRGSYPPRLAGSDSPGHSVSLRMQAHRKLIARRHHAGSCRFAHRSPSRCRRYRPAESPGAAGLYWRGCDG